jgi:tetratricopeptide (TPR) repeat protein
MEGRWVEEQLGSLAALAQAHGEEAVSDFLERMLAAPKVRGDRSLQSRVLYTLAARLSAMTPPDERRLQSCLQRMESLLAQHNDTADVVWLKLRGAVTRLRERFQKKGGEKLSPAGSVLRANELLARSMRTPGDAQALTAAGEAYLDSGLYEVAERCLQKTEDRGVQDGGRSAFLLGQCAFHLEQYERAAHALDHAVTQGWPPAEVTGWQAEALYEIDRYDEAEQCARDGLSSVGGKSTALLQSLIGKIYLGQQNVEEAEKWFAQAYAADATAVEARYGLGLCALARGDGVTAGDLFASLLGHPDGGPLGMLGLGMLAAEQDDTPLAIQHLTEAVRHFPAHGVAHARLGECLFEAGEYAKALRHFSRAQELGVKHSALLLHRGFAALATGDLETGCTFLRAYQGAGDGDLDVTPYLITALVQMTDEALARGDLSRSLIFAEECYQLAPDDPGTAERLGLFLYSAAREQLTTGQVSNQTGEMFARAWELCNTDVTLAGALVAKIFCEEGASLDDILLTPGLTGIDSPFVALVRLLAAYRRGDAEAVECSLGAIPLEDSLLGKIQRFIALHMKVVRIRNRDKLTAEEMSELLAIFEGPEFKQAFAAQREAVNRLLISLLFEAQGRSRPDRVLKMVEDLVQAGRDGFWDEARAFAQLLNASRSDSFAERRNLVALCREMNAVDKPFITDLLVRAERAEIAKLLEASNFAAAYELLAVQVREGRADGLSKGVADAIATFLSTDSLEGAHLAKSVGEIKRAREIWEVLIQKGNAEAAHQMAVSLFAQGYEEVLRKDRRAVQTLSSALPYWKRVHEADAYWQKQRAKCQVLHSNNKPFRQETLEQTRQDLPRGTLAVLAELAIRYARADDRKGAAECVRAILDCPFGRELGRQALEEIFAGPLLAKGVLNGHEQSRFDQALRSAELVLDCDPENRQGLSLALEAAYAQGEDARTRKMRFAKDTLSLFSRARRRLQKFTEQQLKEDAQLVSRCKVYWRELGAMLSLAENQAYVEFQGLAPDKRGEREKLLREIRYYVDCSLNHVLPACRQWTVVDQEWDFEDIDRKLRDVGFPHNPAADF